MMTKFVVIVKFVAHPGMEAAFAQLVAMNAKQSFDAEEGCRQFDVVQLSSDGSEFFLYEIYDNEVAFKEHLESAHFARFERDCASMVASKTVYQGQLLALETEVH
jgi:(4S)-4-hydroxy-5-phosphonooxypentane-2,3-dione isomerase